MRYKPEKVVYSARQPVIRREIAGSTKTQKKKNPNRKTGNTNRKPVSCYRYGKEGHIYHKITEVKAEEMNDKIKEADKWRKWQNACWILKR